MGLTRRVVALSLLLPFAVSAHKGDRVFSVWELPTADLPDLHDGTLEDWEAAVPSASLTHNDWASYMDPGHRVRHVSEEDIAMRLYMAWHDATQQLYLGFEFFDDDPEDEDRLQLQVDGDHSGGPYDASPRSAENLEAVTQAQYYWALLHPADDGSPGWVFEDGGEGWTFRTSGPTRWAYEEPWFEAGRTSIGDGPTLTVLEMKVTPWDQLGEGLETSKRTQLVGGSYIGFSLNFADRDFGQLDGVFLIGDVQQSDVRTSASYFLDAELIPCNHLDCSRAGTLVTRDSWGRIKASLAPD